jgi:hypothetical protein
MRFTGSKKSSILLKKEEGIFYFLMILANVKQLTH